MHINQVSLSQFREISRNGNINLHKMKEVAAMLVGTHDFLTFSKESMEETTVYPCKFYYYSIN